LLDHGATDRLALAKNDAVTAMASLDGMGQPFG